MPTPPPNAQPMPMPTMNPLRGAGGSPVTPPMPARNPMREQQDQGLLELLKAWDRGWQARNQGNRFLRGPQQGPVVR